MKCVTLKCDCCGQEASFTVEYVNSGALGVDDGALDGPLSDCSYICQQCDEINEREYRKELIAINRSRSDSR